METVTVKNASGSGYINGNGNGRFDTISWKAIFAGFFVSLLTYFALMALGIALGSSSLESAAQSGGGSARGFGIGAGIWMIISIFIPIFVGSFAASRVGGSVPIRIGRVQGLVVTALFFAFTLSQVGSAIGVLGSGIGSAVGSLGGATSDISSNQQVQDLMDQAFKNLDLRSPPEQVAQGVATRLVQGDAEGAKNYLASQAGITPQEADARIQELKPKVEAALRDAGATAARVAKTVGWALFVAIVLGSIAGSIGGSLGAAVNLSKPVSRADERAEKRRAA